MDDLSRGGSRNPSSNIPQQSNDWPNIPRFVLASVVLLHVQQSGRRRLPVSESTDSLDCPLWATVGT